MGARGLAWGAVVACVVRVAHADDEEKALFHAELVGSGVVDAGDSAFEDTGDGVREVPSDESGTFPDAVLVGNDTRFYCTGVLVDSRHVLTAGHCADATRVGFGNKVETAIHIAVTARSRHPHLDVAVLRLGRPANVRVHPRRTAADTTPPLGVLRFMGFGVKDHLRLTGFGTKRQVDIGVDGWGCTRARAAAVGCSPADELVVRGQGNDTCLGDSGGPVFEQTLDGWRLVATTSRGLRPRKVICGEGGIYVRTDRIASWLEKEVMK